MKKGLSYLFFTLFCCTLLFLLLFYSDKCILLASNGLLIWYRNMIPSLFPFMVLSGFMIHTGISLKIGQWLRPILGIFFHLPSSMLYAIFMGFLCGFPMGAKIVADMLEKEQITQKEGEYLLAFCNNIGPLYMLGYVIPLFGYKNSWKILVLMYVIPLVYGFCMQYFYAPFINLSSKSKKHKKNSRQVLSSCSYSPKIPETPDYLVCFQQSLSTAIDQITLLGGCMIFFNTLQIIPEIIKDYFVNSSQTSAGVCSSILCSLLEIGGGLKQLELSFHCLENSSLYMYLPLSLLTFGGLSCIVQTYFIIKNTGLKISTYVKHKLVQSCVFIILLLLQKFLHIHI